jgi:hypothetical protein
MTITMDQEAQAHMDAKPAKPVNLALTSPRKRGAARKPATKKAQAKAATLAKGVEKVKARNAKGAKTRVKAAVAEIRADNAAAHAERMESCTAAAVDAGTAEKKLRSRKASKVAVAVADEMAGVELRREPGTGWYHVDVDGSERGVVFKTTISGSVCWRAQDGMAKIKKGETRANAFGSTAAEAAAAFVRQLS